MLSWMCSVLNMVKCYHSCSFLISWSWYNCYVTVWAFSYKRLTKPWWVANWFSLFFWFASFFQEFTSTNKTLMLKMLVLTTSRNLPLTLYFIVHIDTHRLTFTVLHRPAESTDSVRKSLLPPSATKGTEFGEETLERTSLKDTEMQKFTTGSFVSMRGKSLEMCELLQLWNTQLWMHGNVQISP